MLLNIVIVVLVLLLFVVAFMLVRTVLAMRGGEELTETPAISVEAPVVAEHLATALRIETVSSLPPAPFPEREFKELHRLFERLYPHVHSVLTCEVVGQAGLLYTWPGKQPDLPALVLCGHQDVVPADPATLPQWKYPPFSGEIAEGYVWGRGALDDKSSVICILEAVEALLRAEYQPERTVYLAFGQDEETGGQSAKQIAALLAERGVALAAVLDEGGSIMQGIVPGVQQPTALLGYAEKGYLTLHLTVTADPGHSAAPPEQTAITILAAALLRLEKAPLPVRLDALRTLYADLGGAASFGWQFLMNNLWLFGGIVRRQVVRSPAAAALVRTTRAVTLFQGGIKDNLLPARAEAAVNFRLLPGDSIADICEWARAAIDDERVQIEAVSGGAWEASPVSDVTHPIYQQLANVTRQTYPEAVPAPFLVIGATDARSYAPLCPQTYRFTPLMLNAEDFKSVHGINERIEIETLGKMVEFYARLLRAWGELE
ncbi:MAG: M20/M25/M40 family metallo-hydrolase [Longilinea sp.]|nr:M20/M25/M40 family metallo-hydrolase [Longilinea sp.]